MRRRLRYRGGRAVGALWAALALAAGGAIAADPAAEGPFPSTYRPAAAAPTAIVGATLLTGTGAEIADATLLMRDGRVEAVGANLSVPDGYARIDGRGKWVTPGIIDAHSHLGVYPSPATPSHQDGNEAVAPNTAEVWAEHSVWPQDPKFRLARAGGVTTLMVLPGSANLFGGRSVTLRNVPAVTAQGMKFPGAPYGLKMACGENPKRVYGARGRSPATRMGNVAGYRKAWIDAADYARKWDRWESGGRTGEPPKRDLQLETLAGVLKGEILVQNHCYRADEMAVMIDVAHEFGFRIRAFHHANEAYKIIPLLVKEDICVATWANSWGAKMESLDGIEENAPMIDAAGGCAIIHSDDGLLIQRLNQEAGIAMTAANHAGLSITRGEAIRWITSNPARALGIADRVGSLEPGKMADVVLWSANPFSVYALADRVWIDGVPMWDRGDPRYRLPSDFLLGQPGQDFAR
ncbi:MULTISPECIES: amidohydrolase [Sphingopyxis]|uniref:amidohydrolase n=1 Tax=Sphingopyxis TaxID=165697 RepID=UPI000869DE5B|nr:MULTISPECIES: amidohydrolase [Sphingopyxis]APW72033.1 amidohydrolase [Sphingopyxis granuli]AVA12781.1 amidohydrolase [Sphingopyxis sp. MG]ODU29395.1 MAG: amidohydrolase [Sphingopyxis sp. SCN 67-31]